MKYHLKNSFAPFTNSILAVSLLLVSANPVFALCGDPDSNTIINDSFTDGITNNGPRQLGFQTTTSSAALDLAQAPGPVDFASGDVSRTIHSLFPAQTLEELGDRLTFTFDFTTPDTIALEGGGATGYGALPLVDLRFGLFDTSNTTLAAGNVPDTNTGLEIDFSGPIATSPVSPNYALNRLAGIQGELDNINALGTDLGIRTHNVNSSLSHPFPTGRFLQSGNGFDFIAGGIDDVITLLPNADYTGSITVEFTDATLLSLDITVRMFDAAGTFNDSLTASVSIADSPFPPLDPLISANVGVNTTTFDLIAFHATGGAFGGAAGPVPGSSNTGEPNNGIDISNVTITFDTGTEPTVLLGDVDIDGDVDFEDIGPFIAVLQAGTFQAEADCDCNGTVEFADIPSFIAILQEQ